MKAYVVYNEVVMEWKSRAGKRWYERAIEMARLWRGNSNKTKTATDHRQYRHSEDQLRRCTSLKVATSLTLTRVCLCAPISIDPPRRSNSYPATRSSNKIPIQIPNPNLQMRRVVFRGKSVRNDVLMTRFVAEEEAMRRRNQMEAIRKRSIIITTKKKLGPSPLRRTTILA